jgi:hypothetical protein
MSCNCALEFSNIYTTISNISGNMNSYVSNVSSTYSLLNQMVSNQSNINNQLYSGSGNIICGNINAIYMLHNNGNAIINNGNLILNNSNIILNGKIALGSDYGSTGQVLISNGNTIPQWRSSFTRSTTISTNGTTSYAFTGIPSWANKIVIMIINCSTNGTQVPFIQVGIPSGTYLSTGAVGSITGGNAAASNLISGTIRLWNASWASTYVFHSIIQLTNMGSNVWSIEINSVRVDEIPTNFYTAVGSGTVTLTDVLDRIRINANGNTFDGGSMNIMYQ